MNRRDFIRHASSLALLPLVGCAVGEENLSFPIIVHSDMSIGHSLMKRPPQHTGKVRTVENLIIGGGIAGLSAAVKLAGKGREVLVCELSDRWGGTSSALTYQNSKIAQGAHYELQYPHHFDEHLLEFWEELGVVYYHEKSGHWEFEDDKYIIAGNKEGRTWDGTAFREDVLPDTPESRAFLEHIESNFLGKIKLPTRLIASDLHYLNKLTFLAYLKGQFPNLSPALLRAIDYQMLDDYGGTSAQVSALAGVYYYGARPYTAEENVVFSPPQGNFYFIEKLLARLKPETCLLNRMAVRISPEKSHINLEILDTKAHTLETIRAQKVIYAGQKHALKHIYPADYPLFEKVARAPWLVVNIVLKKPLDAPIFWQNEVIKENKSFLGFVNSLAQGEKKQILSAYFCFKPEDRQKLADVEEQKAYWTRYTLREIADFYQIPLRNWQDSVEAAFIQVMGHAMAVPTPDFLLRNRPQSPSDPRIFYAGADVARLPLMLEASDSGLAAAEMLL